ncbi:MAG: hypothetical protein NZ551_06170 [Microscillaceae bacterium]|nr:hypothetical protein [Microscillaceae bacterium]MDW8460780.1 hypothetical protein [Cytophagales bacterium]
MLESVYSYGLVIIFSGIKFIFGPTMSFGLGLSYWEAVCCTTAGMMLYVGVVSFMGQTIRRYIQLRQKRRKLFTSGNRWKVRFWRKYGLIGTAWATPIILTPVGGTMLALSFGEKPLRIIIHMLFSAIFWSMAICFGIYLFK